MARAGFNRSWRTRLIGAPAVATDWAITSPGNAWWRIVSLVATLTTDANAANRRVRLVAGDRSNRWYSSIASADQIAAQTVEYGAFEGATPGGLATVSLNLSLPTEGLLLRPGHRLEAVTTNIQAGDQWSAVMALIDEIPSDVDYVSDVGAETS